MPASSRKPASPSSARPRLEAASPARSSRPDSIHYPVPATDNRDRIAGRFPVWAYFLLASLVFLIIVIPAATLGLVRWVESDRIMPGVEVMGLDIGGLPMTEAAALLEAQWQEQAISLGDDNQQWQVSPQTLGMALDGTATVSRAHHLGRSLGSLLDMVGQPEARLVAPVWTYDRRQAAAYLESVQARLAVTAQDARIDIEDGQAVAIAAVFGRRLDITATLAQLSADPRRVLAERRLPLAFTEEAPAIVDVSAMVDAANRRLATNLNLSLFDPISGQTTERSIAPAEWGAWLSLAVTDPAAGQFQWQIDQTKLVAFLGGESARFGDDSYLDQTAAAEAIESALAKEQTTVSLRLYHRPRTHIVQAGQTLASIGRTYGIPYPWIQQANPDLGDGLHPGQAITIPSADVMLPLPPVEAKRVVVSISQQRVWAYENGQLRWDWPASTGIDSSPTAPGVFQIQSHEPNAYAANWDLHMPSFLGVYRPVPTSDFMNGFHGFPTRDGYTLLWTGDLGHPVTYGCILLSSDNAASLFDWAEAGVVVEIQP